MPEAAHRGDNVTIVVCLLALTTLTYLAWNEHRTRREAQHWQSLYEARLCPLCGADIDGNDPHGPDCPRGEEQ
jgi:hypothetical protein